jgi:hypothetical protein
MRAYLGSIFVKERGGSPYLIEVQIQDEYVSGLMESG